MSGTIRRPDQGVDISGLSRRLDILERRTTPRLTTSGGGFGSNPDWQIGSYVWLQKQVDIGSEDYTFHVGWVDPTDVLLAEAHPGPGNFWTIPGSPGYPVAYAPGVYDVSVGLAINDLPSDSAGKVISFDVGGLSTHATLSSDHAALGAVTLTASWEIVVVRPDIGWSGFDFGGGDLHVFHHLGVTLDDVYANLIVVKIGHVD